MLATVEAYDPQTDSWQQVASMPRSSNFHAAAAVGGKIYVTGGNSSGGDSVNSVCVYDPHADAWTPLANMSIARTGHASAAVGGKLYVFGGYGDEDYEGLLRTAEVYDPASDSWAEGTSLASKRISLVAVAL